MLAVETRKLSRLFGDIHAVTELDLGINTGEIFGFLGSNGAGKTTTIKMLTGQLRSTTGEAWIMGQKVNGKSIDLARLIGVVFEFPNLYPHLTARQNLQFAAELYSVPNKRIDNLLEQMGLTHRSEDSVATLSTGMKQKLSISRAMLHRPPVLFLDEPTTGLDPLFARSLRNSILSLKEAGTTVFLTTHYMEEAEQLCDRVAFIEQGQVVMLDSPANLKRTFGKPLVNVDLQDGQVYTVSLEIETDRRQLATWIERGEVLNIHSQSATLEDVYIEVVGKRIES